MSSKKFFIINLFILSLIFSFLFFKLSNVLADDSSSDAIAIRVIPNPNHFSAQRWYQSQGFSGSPQSLIVDGYKAVRDGRTVYVSATNVDNEQKKLYTNIYLISYNQEADSQTVDIFGKILKNWKFNINLSDSGEDIGYCFISKQNCYIDSDCPSGYVCGNKNPYFNFQENKCVLPEKFDVYNDVNNSSPFSTPSCVLDSDCPGSLLCNSLKSKIIRDVDRLEKISLLKEKIIEYNKKNGRYPVLAAGTYLPHIAVSVWPSWQNVFLNQIGVNGVSDSINKLGVCSEDDDEKKFNLDTCWNSVDNIFVSNLNNHSNFSLPANSYAIAYVSNANGSDYKLCSSMESGLGGSDYKITDGALSDHACKMDASTGNIGLIGYNINNAPYITEYSLNGNSGEELKGFIKAIDPEGHPINWKIGGLLVEKSDTSSGSASGGDLSFEPWTDFSALNWSNFPVLKNTNNVNQKMLWAQKAGNSGAYKVEIILSDNLGSSTSKILDINIDNISPQIIAGNSTHNLSYYLPFKKEVLIKLNNNLSSIKICQSTNGNTCINSWIDIPRDNSGANIDISNGFKANLIKSSDRDYVLLIEGGNNIEGVYKYMVIAKDVYGGTGKVSFDINITSNAPSFSFNNCLKLVELGSDYECEVKANNPEEKFKSISVTGLPLGLTFQQSSKKIQGKVLSIFSSQKIEVSVTNEFNKTTKNSFSLSSFSDCGKYLVKYDGGPWSSDGKKRNQGGYYKTILIGGQCWLQDNLNIGEMINKNQNPTASDKIEKYCYNDISEMCDVYGGLYKWAEMMNLADDCNIKDKEIKLNNNDKCFLEGYLPGNEIIKYKGICPNGWHVPTNDDWHELEIGLRDGSNSCDKNRTGSGCLPAGLRLKSTNMDGDNSSLFNAIGGGKKGATSYIYIDSSAYFWAQDIKYNLVPGSGGFGNLFNASGFLVENRRLIKSGTTSKDHIIRRITAYNDAGELLSDRPSPENNAFSIRCIKDL